MRKTSVSVAPSMVMQAVDPSRRKAPIMVVVCQWPCGAWAWRRWPLGDRPRSRVMLVLAPDSSRKIRRAGSKAACWRSHRRRAWRMSGRFCSLARRVFFYMSVPSVPRDNGWLEECSAPSGPGAFPPTSGRVCGPAFAAVAAGGSEPVWALGRRSDGGGAGRRCDDVAAGVFLPDRGKHGSGGRLPHGSPPSGRKQPGCVRASPGKSFFAWTNRITSFTKWLQFYLKCSSAANLAYLQSAGVPQEITQAMIQRDGEIREQQALEKTLAQAP